MRANIFLWWSLAALLICELICEAKKASTKTKKSKKEKSRTTTTPSPTIPPSPVPDPPRDGEALFLTTYTKGNNAEIIEAAVQRSRINDWDDVEAHSGYITVGHMEQKHLFFVFVKAKNDSEKTPLVLSIQGGPGKSSLSGLFLETGPFRIDLEGKEHKRPHSLQNSVNVIYIDFPVGSGYSFAEHPDDLSKSLDAMNQDMVDFLEQFFKIFRGYTENSFYILGVEYGGRIAVSVASHLASRTDVLPNLKGVICGNTFLGRLLDVIDSSAFLYDVGMIDNGSRTNLREQFQSIRSRALRNLALAFDLLTKVVMETGSREWPKTMFMSLTAYDYQASALYDKRPPEFEAYFKYVNKPDFKRKIHVNVSHELDSQRRLVFDTLVKTDYNVSITERLIRLLDEQNKRILFYAGLMNTLLPARNLKTYVQSVGWKNQAKFSEERAWPWFNPDAENRTKVAGYFQKSGRLTFVELVRAGQKAGFDESENFCEMVRKFVYKADLDKNRRNFKDL